MPVTSAPLGARAWAILPALCLLANGFAVFAVVQSPYGSLGFFDDDLTISDWLLPLTAGALLGALQSAVVSTRIALIVAVATFLLGLATVLYMYPTACFAAGSVVGAGAWTAAVRSWRKRVMARAPVILLLASAAAAVTYGSIDHSADPVPLVDVRTISNGPAVLFDSGDRIDAVSVSGTLADVKGCLGLVRADVGTGTVLVLWPPESTTLAEPFTLTYDGRPYRLGDRITVDVGGLLDQEQDLDAYRPDLPRSCTTSDLIL